MPHEAAAKRIAELPQVSREVMDGLLPELRAYAFTVTGLDVGDQMAKVQDLVKAVPSGEKTWDKARKEIAAELDDALGGKVAQRRAELLLRTHVFRGYAAARYRNLIAQVDVFPFWQYKTHGDGNVRPSHAALNGKIFPAGHDIWQRIFPPWDWGCRCLVVPLTEKTAGRVMGRGRISDQAANDAHLLPTQIATPEMFTDREATIINKNERLPNGIPLNRTPTWSDSPWSETGSVHHDWKLIKARYDNDPEVLAAFEDWAGKTEVAQGVTVEAWLNDGPAALAKKAAKLTLKKSLVKKAAAVAKAAAPRSLTDLVASMTALDVEHQAAQAAATKALLSGTADERRAAHDRLNAVRERAREVCSIPVAERGTVNVTPSNPPPKHLDAGVAIVERYTHKDLMPTVKVSLITGRANCDPAGIINVRDDQTASVIAHEITHATEIQHSEVLQSSRDFVRSRFGKKDKYTKLDTLYPGHGYEDWEFAFEDEWGKRGGNAYSGKIYHRGVGSAKLRTLWKQVAKTDPVGAYQLIYATEALTMGIERLEADPVLFFRDDPDYFRFTVATLQKLTP